MIIRALQESTVKTDIIIFNQGERLDPIEGVTVINSERNFGCSVRHALALCIEDDIFLFHDDDLMVLQDTIEKMEQFLTEKNVVGISGCTLTDGKYTTAIPVCGVNSPVDIVTGRLHLCTKKPIIKAFRLRDKLRLKIWREDDILLSLATTGNVVANAYIENFDEEGIGLSHEPQHYPDRDLICKTIYEAITQKEH
jgi:hypothetical protein